MRVMFSSVLSLVLLACIRVKVFLKGGLIVWLLVCILLCYVD